MRTYLGSDQRFPRKPVNVRNNRAAWAWNAFWDEQEANSRCLVNAHPDVRHTLDEHWVRFAALLAPSAQILDIGCGAGIVGRILLSARSDLHITGVDLASVAPSSDGRLCLMSGIAMEDLPFEDQRFDAAVSQFGFEYGLVSGAAKQAARVLAPGAPFSFIVHHAHSPIVREDRDRDRALHTILGSSVERAFLSGDPANLDHQLGLVLSSAPFDVMVRQIANTLRGRLAHGLNKRRATWNAIIEALAPERELIAALENACIAPTCLHTWLAQLAGPLEISNASVLHLPDGQAIAWTIEGVRPRMVERNCACAGPAELPGTRALIL
jgi:SAM-dependent methyltransferase